MTLKIGLDVQFIKTETAGRDFRESRVVTVCSEITGERKTAIWRIKKKKFRDIVLKVINSVLGYIFQK